MRCRPCRDEERGEILAIINAAAGAYRGVIPADRWHEPYMDGRELESERRTLVGTWGDADWAIDFYRRHGFELVSTERKTRLLRRYWRIPERQIETSVVLAHPPLEQA